MLKNSVPDLPPGDMLRMRGVVVLQASRLRVRRMDKTTLLLLYLKMLFGQER